VVDVTPTNDLAEISQKAGVPEKLQGCHTMFIDPYVIDGHVPVNVVRKLLAEKPAIAGITLPGMPAGSTGMVGEKTQPFVIYAVTQGRQRFDGLCHRVIPAAPIGKAEAVSKGQEAT